MARRKRPVYPPEFKAEAVRRVRQTEVPLVTIARDLGISKVTLRSWVEATRPPGDTPLSTDERTELVQLRHRVRRLEMERDILKKATAFFAKESE